MTFSHLENQKRKMLKRYNNRLKEIGHICEITKPMSSYVVLVGIKFSGFGMNGFMPEAFENPEGLSCGNMVIL